MGRKVLLGVSLLQLLLGGVKFFISFYISTVKRAAGLEFFGCFVCLFLFVWFLWFFFFLLSVCLVLDFLAFSDLTVIITRMIIFCPKNRQDRKGHRRHSAHPLHSMARLPLDFVIASFACLLGCKNKNNKSSFTL